MEFTYQMVAKLQRAQGRYEGKVYKEEGQTS